MLLRSGGDGMIRLPRGALILRVARVEGQQAQAEVRNVEAPAPLHVRQREEFAIRLRLDVIHGVRGRLGAARGDLAVVIAQNRHQRRGTKQLAMLVDERAEGLRALATLAVQIGHVVTERHEQM
ncbi:MAG: hypothetical protein ACK55I_15205, partial [bacterium]